MPIIEKWVPIRNFESYYEVSNYGRVRSKDRVVACSRLGTKRLKGRELKVTVDSIGYGRVTLQDQARKEVWKVHRLVAVHFLKPVPGKLIINHKDNNRINNFVLNIEWCTPRENMEHMVKQNRNKDVSGSKNPMSKLTDLQVEEIRSLQGKLTKPEIAKKFNISVTHVGSLWHNRRRSSRENGEAVRIAECEVCT